MRFGLFEADLRAGELRRSGAKVRLQEQPFQVLAMLLENPGSIVGREDLHARLWPADTFVDFDHGLNAAIKRLRDALGDSAENPRFVETVARRGYRFIAPVNTSAVPVENGVRPPEALPVGANTGRRWRVAVFTAILLVLGVVGGWHAGRRSAASVRFTERRLTANAQDDPVVGAAISPDGKYLAYADRKGFYLRVLATGETNPVALPDGFKARPVSWFPDGSHVLVSRPSLSDDKSSAWSISVFGGNPRQVAEFAEARSVSPDGQQIAVIRGESLNQEIWMISADGASSRKVFGEPGDLFGPAVWSPDGSYIAFLRYLYRPGYHDGEAALGICDVKTGQSNIIVSDPRLGEALGWAPDGRLIYSLDEPPPNQRDSNLWAMRVDVHASHQWRDAQRLTDGPDRKRWLSFSSDGKRLSFLRWNGEPHVYVADVTPGANRLGTLQRLSLDEGRNFPYFWTLDGKTLFFTSDREGGRHLFRQRPDQPAPDLVVGGAETVLLARLNPDGSEIMYLTLPPPDSASRNTRIMRQPVAGSTPQFVLDAEGISNFQCARIPSTVCLLSQAFPDHLSFVRFDAVSGQQTEVSRIVSAGVPKYNWSLSPDGSTLAIAQWRRSQIPAEVELRSLNGGASRKLSVPGWVAIVAIDWAGDGRTLLVSASNPSGTQSLLRVDLRGKATPLWENADKDVGWGIPSPDGRRIALWQANGISNAWLLQGF